MEKNMKNWEKDFENQFRSLAPFCWNDCWGDVLLQIKSFIRQLLNQKEKEIIEAKEKGYRDGHKIGYHEGFRDAKRNVKS
jgi:hypothetical protein